MRDNIEYPESMYVLRDKLREIWDDDEFVGGVLADVWYSEEDRQTLIKFIDSGDDVDIETVTVLAIELGNAWEAAHPTSQN